MKSCFNNVSEIKSLKICFQLKLEIELHFPICECFPLTKNAPLSGDVCMLVNLI